jgi:hypothetical protein
MTWIKFCTLLLLIILNSTESEWEERERTGDIDKFERLDGNGNHPDCYLLVKKVMKNTL